ncbi:MAG: hypothetical protein WCV81_05915 [Microgenomates group bacterium]
MCEQQIRQTEDSSYLPGYSMTPEILDALTQNPDLIFPYGGNLHRVIVRKNTEVGAPPFSAYVQIENDSENGIFVRNKVCGATSMLAALKGINLNFGEEAYRLLNTRQMPPV